jgi:hypothetical protein
MTIGALGLLMAMQFRLSNRRLINVNLFDALH